METLDANESATFSWLFPDEKRQVVIDITSLYEPDVNRQFQLDFIRIKERKKHIGQYLVKIETLLENSTKVLIVSDCEEDDEGLSLIKQKAIWG